MRVNDINVLLAQNSPQCRKLRNKKKWQQHATPAIALEVGKDSSPINKMFPSGEKIAEAHDFHIAYFFGLPGASRMRSQHQDIELIT